MLAVAAYAKAEADPALVYSTLPYVASPYVYPYAAVHAPLVYNAAGCRNVDGAIVPCGKILDNTPEQYFNISLF